MDVDISAMKKYPEHLTSGTLSWPPPLSEVWTTCPREIPPWSCSTVQQSQDRSIVAGTRKLLKYFPCYVQVFSTDLSVCEFTFGIFFDLFLLLRSSSLNNHIFFWLNDHRIYEIFQFLRYFRFIAGLFVSSLLPGWLNHVLSASRSLKEAKLPPPTPKFLAALFVLFPVCPIVLIIF